MRQIFVWRWYPVRMTDVREVITQRLDEMGLTMQWLSGKLRKNSAYIQQYMSSANRF